MGSQSSAKWVMTQISGKAHASLRANARETWPRQEGLSHLAPGRTPESPPKEALPAFSQLCDPEL